MSNYFDTLITGFDNFVSSATGGSEIIGDAVNGALFGAISTAIGGGDVLEGAAWGAAGNAISGAGDESIFNIVGKGVAGYGIDKALGGDGVVGGAGGLLAGYLDEGEGVTRTGDEKVKAGEAPETKIGGGAPAKEQGLLEKYGLQNAEGDGTLLGKALFTAAGSYGQSMEAKDRMEQAEEIRNRSDRHAKSLDEEFEQKKLAGFRQPSMIVRNQ